VTERSQVQLRVGALSGNNLGQFVHAHVPLFTKQYNLVLIKGWWYSADGKVTVGLASHWPCIMDSSGLSTYRLNGQRMGDEHPTYGPDGAQPGFPLPFDVTNVFMSCVFIVRCHCYSWAV